MWADVGFDYDFGFRLRLHRLELHCHELHCFERSADALACIAVAEWLQSSNSLVHAMSILTADVCHDGVAGVAT